MSENILYENIDMLDLMKSVEDKSKDFILLFMPTGKGAVPGYFQSIDTFNDKNCVSDTEIFIKGEKKKYIVCPDDKSDYGHCIFTKKSDYDDYVSLIERVILNGKRILKENGTFCIGIPTATFLIESENEVRVPDVCTVLKEDFPAVRVLDVPNFDCCRTKYVNIGTPYKLYLCGDKVCDWDDDEKKAEYNIERADKPVLRELLKKHDEILSNAWFNFKDKNEYVPASVGKAKLSVLNRAFIFELYDKKIIDSILSNDGIVVSPEVELFNFNEIFDFQDELKMLMTEQGQKFYSLLSGCLIKTFCREGDSALFPYDRNGQYAKYADAYGLKWVSLYVKVYHPHRSTRMDNIVSIDFKKLIPTNNFTGAYSVPSYDKQTNTNGSSGLIKSALIKQNNGNIVYKNVGMIDFMEATEDNSKDFILLFMPTCEEALHNLCLVDTNSIDRNSKTIDDKNSDADTEKVIEDYSNDVSKSYSADMYENYKIWISKVIQNATRILRKNGTFCIAVPTELYSVKNGIKKQLDIKLMLQQLFENIREMDVPYYAGTTVAGGFPLGMKYKLYLCGDKVQGWKYDGEHAFKEFKFIKTDVWKWILEKYSDIMDLADFPSGKIMVNEGFSNLNQIQILEIRNIKQLYSWIDAKADVGPILPYDVITEADGDYVEFNHVLNEEKAKTAKIELDKFQRTISSLLHWEWRYNETSPLFIPLVRSLIETFCNKNDAALFPYDRNGQFSWIASLYDMQWESQYIPDLSGHLEYEHPPVKDNNSYSEVEEENEGRSNGKDDLQLVDKDKYVLQEKVFEHDKRIYDENFLFSAEDANRMKEQLAKYSSLLGQVKQCAADSGNIEDDDMEEAVHAIIRLALKAQKKEISGEDAKKWYGEGWNTLSESCRTYIQTALAFDELSRDNKTADCAPIAIEYCRALELEANSIFVKPFANRYHQNIEDRMTKKLHDDEARLIEALKATYGMNGVGKQQGLTLGGLGVNISKAARKKDGDSVFSMMRQYCEQNGHSRMLDAEVIVKYQMVGKLRNQSAHQNAMDRNCVEQVKWLVRDVLKAQQQISADKATGDQQLICAIIGPDLDDKTDFLATARLKQAIYDEIDVHYQSGVYNFYSVGCTEFNLLFAELLMEYKQERIRQETEERQKFGKKYSIRAYYICLTLYLPCNLENMEISNKLKRVYAVIGEDTRNCKIKIMSNCDSPENRDNCLCEVLKDAQFGIAYIDKDKESLITKIVEEAIEQTGIAIWNGFEIQ